MNKFKKKWIKYCSVTTLIIIVISLIAGIVAHRLPIAENGLDFFANFGGAAIAATIAAALVVYQSIQSHLDVEEEIEQGKQRQIEQQKHENELEQAMAFNRTRPMLYVIAKHYYSKNIERVNPGDRFFIWSKVLDEKSESAAEFIANLDVQNGSESGGLFEIRLFNGEPIHRIKIVFKKLENFDRGSTMYIPYLEPNKRNVIITKDMLLHPWFKADKTRKPGAPKEINNLIREPQSGDTYCSMPRTDVLNFVPAF